MIADIEVHRAELVELCRRHHVLRLSVFGSAARDDFDPERSDLDFLVDFVPLPTGEYADAFFGLLESLQSLFGRPIDLVVDSAIRNPYFRRSVDQTKASLYAA
jgi:predicted nucleotidyltransferase